MTKGIKQHLDELRAICEAQLAQKSSHTWKEPGNKFDHGIRTAKLAERLRTEICPDDTSVNPDVLTVAAWFHDLCNGQEDHENAGADALVRPLGILPSGADAQIRGRTVADAPCKGVGNADHREGYAGGGVAQITQLAVADENLVNDVIQGADQQAHDTGNGEFQQQL